MKKQGKASKASIVVKAPITDETTSGGSTTSHRTAIEIMGAEDTRRDDLKTRVIDANSETHDRNIGSANRYRVLSHAAGTDSDECRPAVA